MKTLPAMAKLGSRPVLLIASEADTESAKAARKLAKGHPQATARVFEGEGHGVTMTGPLIPSVLEFLKVTPATTGR
jgi:hypothetical protein